jgi:hypothetical protein
MKIMAYRHPTGHASCKSVWLERNPEKRERCDADANNSGKSHDGTVI